MHKEFSVAHSESVYLTKCTYIHEVGDRHMEFALVRSVTGDMVRGKESNNSITQ